MSEQELSQWAGWWGRGERESSNTYDHVQSSSSSRSHLKLPPENRSAEAGRVLAPRQSALTWINPHSEELTFLGFHFLKIEKVKILEKLSVIF